MECYTHRLNKGKSSGDIKEGNRYLKLHVNE